MIDLPNRYVLRPDYVLRLDYVLRNDSTMY